MKYITQRSLKFIYDRKNQTLAKLSETLAKVEAELVSEKNEMFPQSDEMVDLAKPLDEGGFIPRLVQLIERDPQGNGREDKGWLDKSLDFEERCIDKSKIAENPYALSVAEDAASYFNSVNATFHGTTARRK
jgi:hypothetical protein